MKLARSLPAGLCACALLLCTACALPGALASISAGPEPAAPKQLEARRIIVTLTAASAERWAILSRGLQADYDLRQVGAFPLGSIGVQCLVFEIPDERSIGAVIAQLRRDARVEGVQRNQIFESQGQAAAAPRSYAGLQYGPRAIHADAAHRWSTGRGVRIAVVDTGVDHDHPDLRDRVVMNLSFVDGGEASFTEDRHGTAIAGIIAARDDDGTGISGVAPGASVLALKACWLASRAAPRAQCSSWTLAKAIDFAIAAGARVLNMSLAGPADPLLLRLLDAAAARSIAIVAAAEPDAEQDLGFPAAFAGALAVVPSDAQDHVRSPGWAARKPLLAAPGVEILTTAPTAAYDFESGSSLAAAHVSGVIALLLEADPQLTPSALADLLLQSARPQTPLGIGIVDACAALARLQGAGGCAGSAADAAQIP